MDLIHHDEFYQYQDWKLTEFPEHLIRYYIKTNLVVVYIRPGGKLLRVIFRKLHDGEFQKINIPYAYRVNSALLSAPEGYYIKYLMSVWPYTEESHLLFDPGAEPRIRKYFRIIYTNDKETFIGKVVDNKVMLANRLLPSDPILLPTSFLHRRLYCRNSRVHEDFMLTGPLHKCYILYCPCKNTGFIGHCQHCGNIIHECIYPGCYFTCGSSTTWHKVIKQYKYNLTIRCGLEEHFKLKHENHIPEQRTSGILPPNMTNFEQVTPDCLKQILQNKILQQPVKKRKFKNDTKEQFSYTEKTGESDL